LIFKSDRDCCGGSLFDVYRAARGTLIPESLRKELPDGRKVRGSGILRLVFVHTKKKLHYLKKEMLMHRFRFWAVCLGAFAGFELHAADVSTKLYLEYVQPSGTTAIYQDQQMLDYAGHSLDFGKRYAVDFNVVEQRQDGRPLSMTISNVWAVLGNRTLPRVSIPFSFPTKRIIPGKVYTCTQGYSDHSECRVQLMSPRVDCRYQRRMPFAKWLCALRRG